MLRRYWRSLQMFGLQDRLHGIGQGLVRIRSLARPSLSRLVCIPWMVSQASCKASSCLALVQRVAEVLLHGWALGIHHH